jgi:hypothetical protein
MTNEQNRITELEADNKSLRDEIHNLIKLLIFTNLVAIAQNYLFTF